MSSRPGSIGDSEEDYKGLFFHDDSKGLSEPIPVFLI